MRTRDAGTSEHSALQILHAATSHMLIPYGRGRLNDGCVQVSLIIIAMATVLSVALAVQTIFGLRSVVTDFLNHTQVPGLENILNPYDCILCTDSMLIIQVAKALSCRLHRRTPSAPSATDGTSTLAQLEGIQVP